MSISAKHPLYAKFQPDWELVQDCYEGETHIKSLSTRYLPATPGQVHDGMKKVTDAGYIAYIGYITRARYHNFYRDAIQTALGMMHHNPPKIALPSKLEYMLEVSTTKGEKLEQLLRRINENQLRKGRIGLLVDIPDQGVDNPYIATYEADSILNWDDGRREELTLQTLNLVVLDESEHVRTNSFDWKYVKKYRVLSLGDLILNEADGVYRTGVFEENFTDAQLIAPSYRGRELNKIPFVFVNTADLVTEPDHPPLLDLAHQCIGVYRLEADYRQNLFMQGQDTFVTIGGILEEGDDDGSVRTGAGAIINLPMGGDAKYVGVESTGLSEQREALREDRLKAGSMGAGTLDTISRERESGTSLQTRISARTANLNQIAIAGAAGLEQALKMVAEWIGANPSEVSIEPNLDFGDLPISGRELVDFEAAINQGAPFSRESLHKLLVDKGLTKKSWEEEQAALQEEKKKDIFQVGNGDQNPMQTPTKVDNA